MTFELLIYIVLISIGSFGVLVNKINFIKFLYIPVFVVFILVIRYSGFESDIVAYARYMHNFSSYMIKEVAFYGMITILYDFLENEIFVFVFIDILFLILIILNIKQYDNRASLIFIPILTLSFPFIMGMENIYRQFLGSIVLILSYSIRQKSETKSNILFIVSVYFHSSLILFLPLLVLVKFFKFNFSSRLFIFTTIMIILIVLLTGILHGVISGGGSNVSSGLNLSYFYYILFSVATVFFVIKFNYKLNIYISKFPSIFYSLFVLFPLVFLTSGGSSAAERIGMSIIMIFILELYMYSLTIRHKLKANLFRLLILLTFSMPTLIFSSSRNFLLTGLV
jgi:hypothetical protein